MTSTLTGDAELKRKLAKLKNLEQLYPALFAAGVHVYQKISAYPPSSEANRPAGPGSRWYERGWGTRWMRKDGSVGGRQTSEDLGHSWTATGDGQHRVIIGNDASYGPYVQGEEQASFHARRKWKTTDQVIEEEQDSVLQEIKKEVDRILATG